MIRDAHEMDRRTVLRGAAGAAGVAGIGGLGILATGPVFGAHTAGSYNFTAPSALTNDTGDLRWVNVVASTSIQWTGFEEPVEAVGYTEVVELIDGTGSVAGPHVYWGQNVDDPGAEHPLSQSGVVGNYGGPWRLDSTRDDQQAGTTGHIDTGGTHEQVLVAEDAAAEDEARGDSAIDTEPLGTDHVFEPDTDGGTQTVTVRKTEYAHLYTTDDADDLVLLHPSTHSWVPAPVEIVGEFDVVVEDIASSTDGTSGEGTADSG